MIKDMIDAEKAKTKADEEARTAAAKAATKLKGFLLQQVAELMLDDFNEQKYVKVGNYRGPSPYHDNSGGPESGDPLGLRVMKNSLCLVWHCMYFANGPKRCTPVSEREKHRKAMFDPKEEHTLTNCPIITVGTGPSAGYYYKVYGEPKASYLDPVEAAQAAAKVLARYAGHDNR